MGWLRSLGRRPFIRLGVVVLPVVAVALVILRVAPVSATASSPARIRDFILGFGLWGPVIFVALYALRAVVLVIPVGIMSLAGGLAYGKWEGTVLILVGATAGSCLAFLLARQLGRRFIERFGWLHRGRVEAFDRQLEGHGFRFILFVRLVPLFQYDAVNFGAGLSRMRFRDFAVGSFIGMAPGGFVNALLGSSLHRVASVQFAVAVGLFVLLALVPTVVKMVKERKGSAGPGPVPGGESAEPEEPDACTTSTWR